MFRAYLTVIAAWGLCLAIGCSQNAPPEAETVVHVADDKPADSESAPKPLPAAEDAEPIADSEPASSEVESTAPVKQAEFLEAVDGPATSEPATAPPVELSAEHAELAKVKVGDSLPEAELPKVGGGKAKLSSLYGKAATVVVFWKGDRQMALDELADLGPDVVEKLGSRGVEVVGVAVDQPAAAAQKTLQAAEAKFPTLVDADGKAFEKIGAEKLPWTLVVDADGKIVWFDLEYSLSTRRELQQALLATVR
jgi:peroxiredoxin